MIGTIPRGTEAERFSDYLVTLGIENMVEENAAGDAWLVWVEHDDHLDRGKVELEAFLKDPADTKYGEVVTERAESIRQEKEQTKEKRRARYIDFRTRWSEPQQWAAPMTLALVIVSCIVTMTTQLGTKMDPLGYRLSIDDYSKDQPLVEDRPQRRGVGRGRVAPAAWRIGLEGVRRGEVWRLVTPIFLHFGILNLIFNMFWIRDLAGMVEMRMGTWRLAGIVLLATIIPNLAQYYWSGPQFGGVSAIIYALFAFVWIKQRYEPWLGLGVSDTMAIILAVFFCLSVLGGQMQAANVVGLLIGGAIAYAPIGIRELKRKMEAK
jgi:GlpG protein